MPLTWLSFACDYALWGMNPVGYHLTNLLLHLLNGCLFYHLALRLFLFAKAESSVQEHRLYACLAALAFTIHPLRVESVAWATERKDVLSGFFYLLALHGYLRYIQATIDPAARRKLKVGTLCLFACSLLAKASTMTFPAVLLLLDFYPLRRDKTQSWRLLLIDKIPFFALAAGAALLAAHGQAAAGLAADLTQVHIDQRIGLACYGALFYLKKMIWPLPLIPIYTAPQNVSFSNPLFLGSVLCVITLSIFLTMKRRSWPALTACWFYYLMVLSPMSGLFQSGSQLAADRYTYLSCMAWPLLLWGAKRVMRFIIVGVLGVWGLLTWNQTKRWHDATTLWSYVAAQDPSNGFAYYNLGDVYQKENRLEEATVMLKQALDLDPDPAVYYKLGMIAQTQHKTENAISYFRQTILLKPSHADAQNSLATTLAAEGHTDEAITVYQNAIQTLPRAGALRNNLGALYLNIHKTALAIEQFQAAVYLDPFNTSFQQNLEAAQARQTITETIDKLKTALNHHPDDIGMKNQLGVLYLNLQDGKNAELYFRAVLEKSPTSGEAYNNVGVALMMQRRTKEGLALFKKAVALDPQSEQFRKNRDSALKEPAIRKK